MLLHLARSETRRWTGRRLYSVTITFDCDDDERRIILAHGFARERIYDAPQVLDLTERAEAALTRAYQLSPWRSEQVGEIYWQSLKGLVLAVRARLGFHLTVADLLAGATLQSTDLGEILAAEVHIGQVFLHLEAAVAHVRRFEAADEDLLAPAEDDRVTHPSTWPRHWRS
jgi:hypothetical protein